MLKPVRSSSYLLGSSSITALFGSFLVFNFLCSINFVLLHILKKETKMHILRIFLSVLIIGLFNQSINAQNKYAYKVNLNEINDDKLQVELITPTIPKSKKVLKFHIPKLVPGTYSIYDFGRFVSEFKAYNKKGKRLKVAHPDPNTWVISKAHKLARITYTVDDTWDTNLDNKIFEPAGTNFEAGKNFVFNNSSVFGFFEDMERIPYEIEVDHPENLKLSTGLINKKVDEDTDLLTIDNYMDLVDGPFMYSKQDFTYIQVGGCKVLVAVYSPTGKITSKFIAGEIEPILRAQREYLGGKLPVDRYAFILYMTDGMSASGGYGALEHSYSSFYYLPEMEPSQLAQTMRDVAAHEFYHIVTPLNIHSEEIHNFNFIEPRMSKHLWLYEGVTEYAAGHVQVKQGLMPIEDYMGVVAGKMRGAESHKDDLPFTDMSLGCLKKHKDEYLNVYQKGALIGMCLDLQLLSLSKGKMTLQDLMNKLSLKFGKDNPFKDNELFTTITELTYPGVAPFFKRYVAGPYPLPIKELMKKVGIEYAETTTTEQKTLGGLENAIGVDFASGLFFIEKFDMLNDFGKEIGFEDGDVIKSWNGVPLTLKNINNVLTDFMMNVKEGDKMDITVLREKEEVQLNSSYKMVEVEQKHGFKILEDATEEQIALRKAWLGDYKVKEIQP